MALRNGGSINASSNFSLHSSGTGGNGDAAGDGTGGVVLLSIANGSLTSPFVRLSSVGFAGNQFSGGTRIGTGFGGSAAINLINSAAVLSADFVSVSAPGQAGRSEAAFAAFGPLAISGSSGGNGQGGTASITVDAGILNATDTLTIAASGEGGDGFGRGAGGTGSGGTASLTVNGGSVSPVILEIGADGRGEFGASNDSEGGTPAAAGGAGTGGSASLLQTGGFLTTGSIALSATGNAPETIFFGEGGSFTIEYGGGGTVFGDGPATGGTGGLGEGGETSLTITGGNLANISGAPVNSISLDSRGVGGNGGDAFINSSSSQLTRGSGGTGRGGTSTFVFSGGSADFTSVNLDASGAGGISGQEFGEVSSDSSNGGDGGSGFGGAGGAGDRTGAGTGGTITLHAEGGLIRTGDFGLFARGFGSMGGQGGAGGTGTAQAGHPPALLPRPTAGRAVPAAEDRELAVRSTSPRLRMRAAGQEASISAQLPWASMARSIRTGS